MNLAMIFALLAIVAYAASAAGVAFGRVSLLPIGHIFLTLFLITAL